MPYTNVEQFFEQYKIVFQFQFTYNDMISNNFPNIAQFSVNRTNLNNDLWIILHPDIRMYKCPTFLNTIPENWPRFNMLPNSTEAD
jgi:hypothetical protein